MLRKFFSATLLVVTLVFAQTVQAMSFAMATDGAKDLSNKYYARAREIAKQYVELRTYSDHGGAHAALVAV